MPDAQFVPPEWRSSAPVMCVAGRGVLDEAASTMLAQVLVKHGLGATVVPHEMVARGNISSLNMDGVAIVWISYLEMEGNTSHLRYLLRRIRQHAPQASILIGLWPVEEAVLRDDRVRAAVSADFYASSLHAAVESCLEAVRLASLASERVVGEIDADLRAD